MVENFHETPRMRHRRTLTGAWDWVYTINVKEALLAARGRVRIQLGGRASGMRQKDTGTPKKKTRRAAGQMVASAVMALAIAVGGFGTTALLASQPAGLTVEPSALLWEGETDAAHSTKKETKKNNTETPKSDSASSEAESTAASAAQPSAPSQSVKEKPAASAAPAAPAEETAAEPAAPETAPSAPMMGGIDELEQENGFPCLQQETEALAAEDPLSAPAEQDAVSQPAEPETNSEEQSTLPVKTEEGTILLTPEEIRAALDAGTLDASNIDTACLTDENGLLSWLWNLLFGKRDDDSSTPAPAPVYSGWRTVGGKTYYYDQYTNQPVTGIQSIDNKLYYFDANGVQQDATFGIDVSKYQSNIDWEQVKTAGVKFVIIRIGYRGYGSGALVLDPMFEQHFTNARNAGLKVGVYFFSQAVNENEAREEAQGCAYVLNGRKLDYPIYFDTEASGGKNGRADGLGVEDRTKCAIAFCEEVKAQGYQPGVYASTLWFRKRIDLNQLKSYSIWNAHYNVAGSPIACDLWQGTCTARIPGYGGQIDVNISYVG